MTIEFSLEVHNKDDNLKPEAILDYLQDNFKFERNELSGILSVKGCTVNSYFDDDPYRESYFLSQFPDLIISFIIDKFDDHDIGIDNMIKTVFALIGKLKEDMILLFDDEEILLKRTSGELVVNSDTDFWDSYDLFIPNMPHKKEGLDLP